MTKKNARQITLCRTDVVLIGDSIIKGKRKYESRIDFETLPNTIR